MNIISFGMKCNITWSENSLKCLITFDDIDLSDVDLSDVDLSGVDLSDLSDVDLSNVDLSNVDLGDVDLGDVDLSEIDLSSVDLSDVDLSALGVDLPSNSGGALPNEVGDALGAIKDAAKVINLMNPFRSSL